MPQDDSDKGLVVGRGRIALGHRQIPVSVVAVGNVHVVSSMLRPLLVPSVGPFSTISPTRVDVVAAPSKSRYAS